MNGILYSLLAALLGYLFVRITIPPLIRVVKALHIFEKNEGRKVHNDVIPTIGGVSIFFGFLWFKCMGSFLIV